MSNLTLAAGLALLGGTYSIPVLVVAWLLLGIGMGCGLYDAAFAALGRIYGDNARRSYHRHHAACGVREPPWDGR